MFSRLWNTDVTGKTFLDVLNKPTVASKKSGRATFAIVSRDEKVANDTMVLDEVITWNAATNTERMGKPKALMTFLLDTFGSPVRFCTEYVRNTHIGAILAINRMVQFTIG
jgi:hypothetical protein